MTARGSARLDHWREPMWPADEVSLCVEFLEDGELIAAIFGSAISSAQMFPAVGAAFAEVIAQRKAPL